MELEHESFLSLKQQQAGLSSKNVQEVSKISERVRRSKSDVRYWQDAVFCPTYTWHGVKRFCGHWAVKVQYGGRRETIPLGTLNKTAAAFKAKEFYLCLQASGWDAALLKFKPKSRWSDSAIATVGDFLAAVRAVWSGRSKTFNDYAKALRKIVADSFGIEGGQKKFDCRKGGRDAWAARVERIKLRELTPERVQKWKVGFLRRAGSNPVRQRAAAISVNSLLRQAKSLFAPALLKFVRLEIPCSPFEGVEFEPRRSMRYQSSFDVESLIRAAQEELPQEQFKIFLLAIMAGLRRNEIDKLKWTAFDWKRGSISIRATSYFSPKSEDSSGEVEIDAEMTELFRGFFARATGDFVIESRIPVRSQATYAQYRCGRDFAKLLKWLRDKGVEARRPLHTLRKEFGSQVCARHGIYAASRALRHADIAITSQHYLDKRQRATVGLGGLLFPPANVIKLSGGSAGPQRGESRMAE